MIKRSGLEALPTGYMLIDGGNRTSVQYISNTQPIPADKPDIAGATALAGAMLGLQYMYLDAGSGAVHPVKSGCD
jgi:putative glycerol-1-phosphate prenyltransferase